MVSNTLHAWVILLRGINVGGVKVPMADLKKMLEGLGMRQVKTLLASGNVIVDADLSDAAEVKRIVEEALATTFGRPISVIVRPFAGIQQMVAADPSRLLLITGKAAPPGPSVAAGADPRIAPVEQALRNGEIESVRFEEAKSFQWNGTEEIGGEFAGTYETVTVLFDVTTIFGTFRVEYKALLKGGKVVIWIDPVTEDRVS